MRSGALAESRTISSGYDVLSFTCDVLIITSQITVFGTGYSMRPEIAQGFDQEKKSYKTKGAKCSFYGIF